MMKKNTSYLKKAKIFYLYFFILILMIFVFAFYQNFATKSAVNQFFKTTGLSKNDISYKSVSKSLFGNSLIFYQVTFDTFSFENHIDKMVLKKEKNNLQVSLTNAQIDVIHSLRKTHNINIIKELDEYKPITDIFQKPLLTLALSNIDTFSFNLDLIFNQEHNMNVIKGILVAKNEVSLQFKTIAFKEPNGLNARLKPLYVTAKDNGLFEKYDQYLKSIGYKKTQQERQLLTQQELKWTEQNMPELQFVPTYKTYSKTQDDF